MNTTQCDTETRVIKVWDPLVRIFHWSLLGFFTLAWLSAEEIETLHVWSGYAIAALLAFRLVWGLIGSRHARFIDFVPTPSSLKRYLLALRAGTAPRYLGHNPAGGAMVIALLLSLSGTILFGMALLGSEGEGPLASAWLATLPEWLLEGVHELCANLTLGLAALHVGGVLFSSLHHRENLVRSMFTGFKARRPGDIDHSPTTRQTSSVQEQQP